MADGSEDYNLLIVSDLHLSEGLDPASGKLSPREDFVFDQEFARFLEYHTRAAVEDPRYRGRRWKLILNGDAFCFLQVIAKPRYALYTFDQDEEGWRLRPYLPAGQRCYAANGSLRLEASFSGGSRQQAGAAVYLPADSDFSGYARLCARVHAPHDAQNVHATFRVTLGPERMRPGPQWSRLEPGQWNEVAFELGKPDTLPLQQVRTVELRVASSTAQSGTFCVDEVWAEPLLSRREVRYGLGTTATQAAWKLRHSGEGHPCFFQSLARFVARGHRVVYVKGNHDVDTHWPLVQDTFRDLVVEAAEQCPELGEVDQEQTRANVEFYPWIYYEPGIAYVEHGNQYEPVNFFRDFLNPVLPGDPQRLELPLGSFFVRYVFNSLETIHPWGDNVKPSSDYIKWAFKTDPLNTLGVVVDNMGLVLRAVWEAWRKRAVVPKVDRSVPAAMGERRAMLAGLPPNAMRDIAEVSLNWVADWWRRILRTLALGGLSFILLVGVILLFFKPLLDFIRLGLTRMPWLMVVTYLAGSLALFIVRRLVEHKIESEAEGNYLRCMAGRIAVILSRHGLAVPYLVFGHTHNADVVKLPRWPELSFDQWYVNTGTWTQVLSEEERLIRDRKQFTFFEIVPGEEQGRPRLWHWNDDAGRPAPVLLLGGQMQPDDKTVILMKGDLH